MTGRLVDYVGSGAASGLPAAATVHAALTTGAAGFYYASDTQTLYCLDRTGTPSWDKLSLGAAPSIQSVASSATVTPTFADDQVNITAQAAALALANPTGTPIPGWGIGIRIKDNGTARAISYDTQYRAIGVTLPTTTVLGKTLYLGMIFNSTDTKWDVISVAQQA